MFYCNRSQPVLQVCEWLQYHHDPRSFAWTLSMKIWGFEDHIYTSRRGGAIGRSSIVATLEGKSLVYCVFPLISCQPRHWMLPCGLGETQAVTLVSSWIGRCSTYLVRTGTCWYTTCYGTVPPCSALFEYVLLPKVRTSTYYLPYVRIEYVLSNTVRKSTYLTLKVQTFRVAYQYVPVRT